MPSLIVLRSRLRVAVLSALALLLAVPAPTRRRRSPRREARPAGATATGGATRARRNPRRRRQSSRAAAAARVTVKLQYVTGDKTTTSTVAMKGARQRIDYGTELVVLQECDLGRIVQVSDANKKYLVATATPPSGGAPPGAASGVVTYTTTVTDTGERKTMFNATGAPHQHDA